MSFRLVTQTSPAGFDAMYSTNIFKAMDLAGLPVIRQCSPIVIILGFPARPSAYRTSNAAARYSKKAWGEKAPVVEWYFRSLQS